MFPKKYLRPPPLDHRDHILERVIVLPQQIGDDDSSASTDPSITMDENIGFFPNTVDELVSFLKVFGQIFGRVIIDWNVEVVCNLFLSMLDNTSLYCSHNSFDSQF